MKGSIRFEPLEPLGKMITRRVKASLTVEFEKEGELEKRITPNSMIEIGVKCDLERVVRDIGSRFLNPAFKYLDFWRDRIARMINYIITRSWKGVNVERVEFGRNFIKVRVRTDDKVEALTPPSVDELNSLVLGSTVLPVTEIKGPNIARTGEEVEFEIGGFWERPCYTVERCGLNLMPDTKVFLEVRRTGEAWMKYSDEVEAPGESLTIKPSILRPYYFMPGLKPGTVKVKVIFIDPGIYEVRARVTVKGRPVRNGYFKTVKISVTGAPVERGRYKLTLKGPLGVKPEEVYEGTLTFEAELVRAEPAKGVELPLKNRRVELWRVEVTKKGFRKLGFYASAVTDERGLAELKAGFTPGDYVLAAYWPDRDLWSQPVEVRVKERVAVRPPKLYLLVEIAKGNWTWGVADIIGYEEFNYAILAPGVNLAWIRENAIKVYCVLRYPDGREKWLEPASVRQEEVRVKGKVYKLPVLRWDGRLYIDGEVGEHRIKAVLTGPGKVKVAESNEVSLVVVRNVLESLKFYPEYEKVGVGRRVRLWVGGVYGLSFEIWAKPPRELPRRVATVSTDRGLYAYVDVFIDKAGTWLFTAKALRYGRYIKWLTLTCKVEGVGNASIETDTPITRKVARVRVSSWGWSIAPKAKVVITGPKGFKWDSGWVEMKPYAEGWAADFEYRPLPVYGTYRAYGFISVYGTVWKTYPEYVEIESTPYIPKEYAMLPEVSPFLPEMPPIIPPTYIPWPYGGYIELSGGELREVLKMLKSTLRELKNDRQVKVEHRRFKGIIKWIGGIAGGSMIGILIYRFIPFFWYGRMVTEIFANVRSYIYEVKVQFGWTREKKPREVPYEVWKLDKVFEQAKNKEYPPFYGEKIVVEAPTFSYTEVRGFTEFDFPIGFFDEYHVEFRGLMKSHSNVSGVRFIQDPNPHIPPGEARPSPSGFIIYKDRGVARFYWSYFRGEVAIPSVSTSVGVWGELGIAVPFLYTEPIMVTFMIIDLHPIGLKPSLVKLTLTPTFGRPVTLSKEDIASGRIPRVRVGAGERLYIEGFTEVSAEISAYGQYGRRKIPLKGSISKKEVVEIHSPGMACTINVAVDTVAGIKKGKIVTEPWSPGALPIQTSAAEWSPEWEQAGYGHFKTKVDIPERGGSYSLWISTGVAVGYAFIMGYGTWANVAEIGLVEIPLRVVGMAKPEIFISTCNGEGRYGAPLDLDRTGVFYVRDGMDNPEKGYLCAVLRKPVPGHEYVIKVDVLVGLPTVGEGTVATITPPEEEVTVDGIRIAGGSVKLPAEAELDAIVLRFKLKLPPIAYESTTYRKIGRLVASYEDRAAPFPSDTSKGVDLYLIPPSFVKVKR